MVSGTEFRAGLRHNMPGAPKTKEPRVVPAFTIQAMQKGTVVKSPPKCGAFKPRPLRPTSFRNYYKRGEFPISIEVDKNGNKVIAWKVDIEKLDFHHYLPMFFDGLREVVNPYKFFAQQGIRDMILYGGNKVFPVIPQLIIPIKKALHTKNRYVLCATLRAIQNLIQSVEMAGVALVPYYRQILPILNMFKEKNVNCGDAVDFSQQRGENIGDLINETLEMMERYGGEDAFINIKYMIPTYESCMQN